MKKLLLFVLIITLTGCATIGGSSKITYTPEVRRQSVASDPLFHDLLTAIGGVGYADKAAYPNAKERTLVGSRCFSPTTTRRLAVNAGR